MTINKAIQHFIFKLSNHWKATEVDQQALNVMIDFVNDKSKEQYMNNELFAKVYIFMFSYFIDRYKTTVFDEIPQKELHRYLDQPIERIVERFTEKLNDNEIFKNIEEQKLKHPANEQEIKVDKSILNKEWTFENVSSILEIQINKAIESYG